MGRRQRAFALSLLAALLISGCADDPVAPGPARPSESAGFVSGGECNQAASESLPADAGCVTSVAGDADGDGVEDTLVVFARVDSDRLPRSWHTHLDTASGQVVQRLDAGSRFSYPRAIGAADVEGDGRDEWFIKVLDLAGHGTAWQMLNLFVVRDGKLKVLRLEGSALSLRVGGVSRQGDGVGCSDGELFIFRAEARNPRNTRWETATRRYTIDGAAARLVGDRSGELRIADYTDPALDRFYGLDCAGLRYLP